LQQPVPPLPLQNVMVELSYVLPHPHLQSSNNSGVGFLLRDSLTTVVLVNTALLLLLLLLLLLVVATNTAILVLGIIIGVLALLEED
jgi:lipoprotein signal peptidase